MESHHLVEHSLDFLIAVSLLTAIYYQRSTVSRSW